jgi:hypothetical protein
MKEQKKKFFSIYVHVYVVFVQEYVKQKKLHIDRRKKKMSGFFLFVHRRLDREEE